MPSAEHRKTSRAECVSHDIEERVARLRKSLALLDQRIASDEAARRNEAHRLRGHVDGVLAKVASLERLLRPARRSRAVKGTIIMRAGQVLAAATNTRPGTPR
jgi:hypothetical protein